MFMVWFEDLNWEKFRVMFWNLFICFIMDVLCLWVVVVVLVLIVFLEKLVRFLIGFSNRWWGFIGLLLLS